MARIVPRTNPPPWSKYPWHEWIRQTIDEGMSVEVTRGEDFPATQTLDQFISQIHNRAKSLTHHGERLGAICRKDRATNTITFHFYLRTTDGYPIDTEDKVRDEADE